MRVLTKVLPKAIALLIAMAMVLAPIAVTNVQAEAGPVTSVTLEGRTGNDDAIVFMHVGPIPHDTVVTVTMEAHDGSYTFDGRFDLLVRLAGSPWQGAVDFNGQATLSLTTPLSAARHGWPDSQPIPSDVAIAWVGVNVNSWGGPTPPTSFTMLSAYIDGQPVNLATVRRAGLLPHGELSPEGTGLIFNRDGNGNGDRDPDCECIPDYSWGEACWYEWLTNTPEGQEFWWNYWITYTAEGQEFWWNYWLTTPEGQEFWWNYWITYTAEGQAFWWDYWLTTPEGHAFWFNYWWYNILTEAERQAYLLQQEGRRNLYLTAANYERFELRDGDNVLITFILVQLPEGYSNAQFSIAGQATNFSLAGSTQGVYRYAFEGSAGALIVSYQPPQQP